MAASRAKTNRIGHMHPELIDFSKHIHSVYRSAINCQRANFLLLVKKKYPGVIESGVVSDIAAVIQTAIESLIIK